MIFLFFYENKTQKLPDTFNLKIYWYNYLISRTVNLVFIE